MTPQAGWALGRGLLVAVSLLSFAAGPIGAQSDDAEVRAIVEDLFRHMKAGDADAMAELMHEDVRLVTTAMRDEGPTVRILPVQRWLDAVRASTRVLDERLHDIDVRVSEGLATVWTRYDLFVDGEFSHCGVDAVDLVRTATGWRIIQIADTRTSEGCQSP